DIVDPDLARDVLHLHRLPLVHERRVPGDDEEIVEPGQLGDDVLAEAVGEELLLGVATHIDEGQHHQGRFGGRAWLVHDTFQPRAGLLVEHDPEDADGPDDVLDALFAEILERDVKPVAHLISYGGGNTDPVRSSQLLQPRRYID